MGVFMNKNKLILLLTAILLISGMTTDIYIPSLPEITLYFKTTEELASFTISIFVIALAVSGLVAAMISDRFGRKSILMKANITFIMSTLAIAFSPNIHFFIFFRMVQGIAVGVNFIVTRQIIKDLFSEKEQININSILFTAFVLSPAVAPIVGSIIAEYLSWRACFVFIFLCLLILAYYIKHFLEETIPQKKKIPHPITYIGSFAMFFMTKNFNACVLITSFSYAGYFVFLTTSSYIFINKFDFSAIGYSIIFVFLAVVYLIGNYIMRVLNTRDMPKPTIIFLGNLFNLFGGILLGVAVISPFKPLAITALIGGAIFMRFGLGFMLALVQIMAMNLFLKNGGQALGTLTFIQNCIASVAAIWAAKYSNLLLGFFVVTMVFNVAAMLTHLLLFSSHFRFPNLKNKIFRKAIKGKKVKKYIELNPYWKSHK